MTTRTELAREILREVARWVADLEPADPIAGAIYRAEVARAHSVDRFLDAVQLWTAHGRSCLDLVVRTGEALHRDCQRIARIFSTPVLSQAERDELYAWADSLVERARQARDPCEDEREPWQADDRDPDAWRGR